MSDLASQFASTTITGTSPDGNIKAEVSWDGHIRSLTFRPGTYRDYSEQTLSRQLSRLATLLWTRQRQYYREFINAAFTNPIHDDAPDIDPHRREYRQRRDQIVATGQSADGLIRIRFEAGQHWRVHISEAALQRHTERSILADLSEATTQVVVACKTQVARLKKEIYASPP